MALGIFRKLENGLDSRQEQKQLRINDFLFFLMLIHLFLYFGISVKVIPMALFLFSISQHLLH